MQPSFCARDTSAWAYPKPRPPHPGFTKCARLMLNPACLIVSNEKDLGHEPEPVMLERGATILGEGMSRLSANGLIRSQEPFRTLHQALKMIEMDRHEMRSGPRSGWLLLFVCCHT